MVLRRLLLAAWCLWTLWAVAGAQAAPVRILSLGDSITQSDADHLSYRYYLARYLKDQGTRYDFVGTMDEHRDGTPDYPRKTFDRDHEGHSGWRTTDILDGRASEPDAGRLRRWLKGYDADVALIHLGTNDVLKGVDANDAPNSNITIKNLKSIIRVLRHDNPNITIVVAKLIPLGWSKDAVIRAINAKMPAMQAQMSTAQSPVHLLDLHTGFDKDWLYDALHPDETGERWMARRFLRYFPAPTNLAAPLLASSGVDGPIQAVAVPTPAASGMGLALVGAAVLRRRS